MEITQASVDSTLSWNTFLSSTSVSSLTCAIFSEQQSQSVHGLEDVIRAVGSLRLRRYRYEELAREETLGEGETYLVEKAIQGGTVFAVKHMKISNTPDEKTFRRRLTAVTVEAHIMRHSPLRAHPNLPSVIGYGWNLRGELIIPFLVVEYAPFGTLREYIQKFSPTLSNIEILLGDVASALAALHVCGIVHGDVKLDNVLVFPSWDRPAKALAKLTDFGHAIILNGQSNENDKETVKYGGTIIYNAPEVRTQDLFPIEKTEVWKCDTWAFGLLVWEACIGGEEYIKYLARNGVVVNTSGTEPGVSATEMLQHAKRCLPAGQLSTAMFLRVALHKTIQGDPLERAASMRDLRLFTRWNNGGVLGLEADLALHVQAPTPTYEMFRLDTGKEILWNHQQQIFQGLKHTHTNNLARNRVLISWQIALCYHTGFGTPQDARKAHEYSEMAKSELHPLASAFGHLLDPHTNGSLELQEEEYATKISDLLRSDPGHSKAIPSLVKAFFDGNSPVIFDLLSEGISLSSSAVDGCSPFHWLFMFQDTALEEIVSKLSEELDTSKRLVNLPMCSARQVHDQWPLQLLGSPLAVAISVNSLPAVKALLSLGADPFSLVYSQTQLPSNDSRSQWTAFHVAAKYHCSGILAYLLEQTISRKQTSINSLACVLSSSTSLERLAMHGSNHTTRLDETVRLIGGIQSLGAMDTSGRTGLMMAIDFQDYHVAAALLHSNKALAKIPFRSPKSPGVFTYPVHFSAQIAARRDVPETLTIPKLLGSYLDDVRSMALSRDHTGKTPLHLAVTGPSTAVTGWILEENIELLQIEDQLGRTPLHYCASSANLNLLLNKGAGLCKKAMALLAGRKAGILSVLQDESKDAHEIQSIPKTDYDDIMASGFEIQPSGNLSAEFLWDEDSVSVVELDVPTGLRQRAYDNLSIYEKQQETYAQRKEKLEKLDQIISTVTWHLPRLYRNRRATTAVVTLLSVFFDDIIWQPGIADRMIEVIARAAHDLAYIMHFYVEMVQNRAEAWAGFLATYNGILLKETKQLDSFWKYMEDNDPVDMSEQEYKQPEDRSNHGGFEDGIFMKRIFMESLLCYMEKAFPFKIEGAAAPLNRNIEDVNEVDIRNVLAEWETFSQKS
ncbi:putative serine/threonine-protein kinase gdt4 [Colletotrichum tropicale]|nr:putative serine/threonine-protein kinase gdt4 [Colletotrichum tropicale]